MYGCRYGCSQGGEGGVRYLSISSVPDNSYGLHSEPSMRVSEFFASDPGMSTFYVCMPLWRLCMGAASPAQKQDQGDMWFQGKSKTLADGWVLPATDFALRHGFLHDEL